MLCDILVCPNLVSYLYPIIKSISLINLAELGNVYVLCIHYLSWITNLYTLPPENAKKKKIRIRFENWWAVLARQFSDKSCANYPYQGIMTCEWVKTSFLMAVQSKCDVSLLFFDYILLRSIWNIQSFINVTNIGHYINRKSVNYALTISFIQRYFYLIFSSEHQTN